MAKKGFLALIIAAIILLSVLGYFVFFGASVTVYNDGENITVTTVVSPFSGINTNKLNGEIEKYTFEVMNNPNSDTKTLTEGIQRICSSYGLNHVKVKIDSPLGLNKIPVLFHVNGTSMYPTIDDGQTVLLEKTKTIHVNDIVIAKTPHFGNIIKRVSEIKGNKVLLVSDNKDIKYEVINGTTYQTQGINIWVTIDDIYGVVVKY